MENATTYPRQNASNDTPLEFATQVESNEAIKRIGLFTVSCLKMNIKVGDENKFLKILNHRLCC